MPNLSSGRTRLTPPVLLMATLGLPAFSALADEMSERTADSVHASGHVVAPAAAPALAAASAFEDDDIVATVNGRPIPDISLTTVMTQLERPGAEPDREATLQRLIDMEVLAQAAERAGLNRRPDVASALLLQYTQTLANAWLADQDGQLSFDEQALRAEYAQQVAALPDGDYRAAHILVAQASEAQALIAMLQDGADFSELAGEHSIDANAARGGEFGWLSSDALAPELAEALAKLAPGAVAQQPVMSDFGAHVLKLHEKRSATPPAFETVRDALDGLLVRRALEARTAELRARADIQRR